MGLQHEHALAGPAAEARGQEWEEQGQGGWGHKSAVVVQQENALAGPVSTYGSVLGVRRVGGGAFRQAWQHIGHSGALMQACPQAVYLQGQTADTP